MATDPPWKKLERRCRSIFGGVRLWRPDFGDTAPDGESATWTWDSKCYARHAVVSLWVECEKKYRAFNAGRSFALVLFSRDRPRAGDFVLIHDDDFTRLLKKAGEYGGGPV
jgi:hypothetical protein